MDVRIVNTTEGLNDLQEPWECLEKQDPDISFYSSFQFIIAWWDSFRTKPDIRLHIVCVYQNQTLVGIGPFVVDTERKKFLTWKVLLFAGRGDYFNVITDRSLNPETILKYMFKALEESPDWDIIRLSNISAYSQLAAYFFKSGDNQFFQHQIENPYVDLASFKDFGQFKTQLPSKVVKLRNKLQREVGFQFQVVPGNQNDIFSSITQLHRLEKQFLVEKMGRSDRHSLYEDKYILGFVANVFDRTDNVLTFLYNDREGNMLGYKTCYLYNRVVLSWNGGYNPHYFKYSIGKILYYDILEYIIENRLADRFDWGAGRYQWKFEWTSNFTATYKYEKPMTKKGKRIIKSRSIFQAIK